MREGASWLHTHFAHTHNTDLALTEVTVWPMAVFSFTYMGP